MFSDVQLREVNPGWMASSTCQVRTVSLTCPRERRSCLSLLWIGGQTAGTRDSLWKQNLFITDLLVFELSVLDLLSFFSAFSEACFLAI